MKLRWLCETFMDLIQPFFLSFVHRAVHKIYSFSFSILDLSKSNTILRTLHFYTPTVSNWLLQFMLVTSCVAEVPVFISHYIKPKHDWAQQKVRTPLRSSGLNEQMKFFIYTLLVTAVKRKQVISISDQMTLDQTVKSIQTLSMRHRHKDVKKQTRSSNTCIRELCWPITYMQCSISTFYPAIVTNDKTVVAILTCLDWISLSHW